MVRGLEKFDRLGDSNLEVRDEELFDGSAIKQISWKFPLLLPI